MFNMKEEKVIDRRELRRDVMVTFDRFFDDLMTIDGIVKARMQKHINMYGKQDSPIRTEIVSLDHNQQIVKLRFTVNVLIEGRRMVIEHC